MSEEVFKYVKSFRRHEPSDIAKDIQRVLDDFDDDEYVMVGHELYYSTAMTQDEWDKPVWQCSVIIIISYKQK